MFHVIYILRTYLGMSQCKLAKLAGVTQPDLSELENLPPYGRVDKYCRVAEALGVSVDTLVKNDPRTVPLRFFDEHPAPEFTPAPNDREHLLGRQGEEFILRRERERLEAVCPALAKLILPFYKMKCPSPGFDLLSFDDEGKPVCLEVKTSEAATGVFRLTTNEYNAACQISDAGVPYQVCCISDWGTADQIVEDIPFSEVQEYYQITPLYYRCAPCPTPEILSGLAYFRRKNGLRQEDVAEALDINQSDLCLYETGARQVPVNLYLKASELYRVPIDDLLLNYEAPLKRIPAPNGVM